MEIRFLQLNTCHLLIAHHNPSRIAVGVEFRFNPQTLASGRTADQIGHPLVASHRGPPPVDRNMTEHSVLDPVPLAGSRREMADRQSQAQFVSQALQRKLPQATPGRVAPAAIGGNQQFARRLVELRSQVPPPAAQRFDRKFGGVVITSYTDPTSVGRQVINSIRNGLAQFFVDKVMDAHQLGHSLRPPFPPALFEIADQFFLLGIDRDNGLRAPLESLHLGIDIFELSVAIRMRGTFFGLAVGLQTVVELLEQVGDLLVPNLKALLLQFCRQFPDALTVPAQRRLWIATARRVDYRVERCQQRGLVMNERFATATGPANATSRQQRAVVSRRHVLQAKVNDAARDSSHLRDQRLAATANRFGFGRRPQAASTFIHRWRESYELFSENTSPRQFI